MSFRNRYLGSMVKASTKPSPKSIGGDLGGCLIGVTTTSAREGATWGTWRVKERLCRRGAEGGIFHLGVSDPYSTYPVWLDGCRQSLLIATLSYCWDSVCKRFAVASTHWRGAMCRDCKSSAFKCSLPHHYYGFGFVLSSTIYRSRDRSRQ